jgi:lipid-A-disaccharide synthase-like uncharacterized protein
MGSWMPRFGATNAPAQAGEVDELSIIPRWSIVAAVAVFVLTQYFFHAVMPHNRHEIPVMRVLMGYSWGTAFSSYVLLVGYVSRDVKRRRMPALLWMLIVLLPGGIGAVVYFLLRQPILSRCPNCSTELSSSHHFCPQCQFQMAPVCGRCFRGTKITDVYCVQCGHDLAEDSMPARLRSYSD